MEYGIPFTVETPLGDVLFNQELDDGGMLLVSEATGFDGAGVRSHVEDLAGRPGAIVFPAELGASYPGLRCTIIADTTVRRHEIEQDTRGKMNSIRKVWGLAKWTHSDGTMMQQRVILVERLSIQGDRIKEILLPMVSDAGVKYSQTLHTEDILSGDVATITNAGDADSWPVLQLHGGFDGLSVQNYNALQTFTYEGTAAIALGEYIEIDTKRDTYYLNGDSTLPMLEGIDPASDTFPLVSGDNIIEVSSTTGEGTAFARLIYRDAYA